VFHPPSTTLISPSVSPYSPYTSRSISASSADVAALVPLAFASAALAVMSFLVGVKECLLH